MGKSKIMMFNGLKFDIEIEDPGPLPGYLGKGTYPRSPHPVELLVVELF